jgi:hypothetical protein
MLALVTVVQGVRANLIVKLRQPRFRGGRHDPDMESRRCRSQWPERATAVRTARTATRWADGVDYFKIPPVDVVLLKGCRANSLAPDMPAAAQRPDSFLRPFVFVRLVASAP